MRALMIQNVTNDQLSAAIDNFANSPFPMDIHGEIALSAMHGETDRRRQKAPEFLVEVVDPCADKLGEFSLDERGWIELLAERARNQAKTRIRADKAASNAARSNTEAEKLLNLRFQADDEMVMALGAIPK